MMQSSPRVRQAAVVRSGQPSWTAQSIALARSHLDRSTVVVSDPWANGLLRRPWRVAARCLQLPGLRDLATKRAFAHLAARTCAYDEILISAMQAGVRQVVIVGAGYDSRSLRLARPGVRFFEVDHPATQHDKQQRLAHLGAPTDSVVFVAVDLADRRCADLLVSAGLNPEAPTVFAVEGLSMYLSADANISLLGDLATIAAAGSTLGVDFAAPTAPPPGLIGVVARAMSAATKAMMTRANETVVFLCSPDDAQDAVRRAGWTVQQVMTARRLWERYLSDNGWPAPRPEIETPIIVIAEVRL